MTDHASDKAQLVGINHVALLLGKITQSATGISTRTLILESSRRLGDHWRMTIEAYGFLDLPADDPLSGLRDDDLLRLELSYYF